MNLQPQVNGADPAAFFEMATETDFYRDWMSGVRDDLGRVSADLQGLRSNLNQLGNQITRIEAFDLHARLQTQTARIDILEKDKAKYEGQLQTLRYISSLATFISVVVGLILLVKGLK